MGYYWNEIGSLNTFVLNFLGMKSSFQKTSAIFDFSPTFWEKTLGTKFINLNCRAIIVGKCIFWRFFVTFSKLCCRCGR